MPADSDAPRPRHHTHLPGLDGLRGLAVIAVVAFHADGALRGGYLGVDVFFVLSGFLITGILLNESRATGGIDLKNFWVRRARRLFPALLALMPVVAIYGRWVAKRDELAGLRADAIATLAYVANWRNILSHKSYWQLFAAPSPLAHTWSLSIEEQFYVLWPLLVTAILVWWRGAKGDSGQRGERVLRGVTVALFFASAGALLALFNPANTNRAYFGTDTRAAAILCGAWLALTLRSGMKIEDAKGKALDAFGILGLGIIAALCATLDGQGALLYRGGFWLCELACLALIACAAAVPEGITARLLSLRPLRYAGTISYGVYLWHWPIDCALTVESTHVQQPLVLNAMRVALTLAVAAASFKFLEQPIRARGLPWGKAYVVVPASFAVALAAVFAGTKRPPPPPPPPVVASRWPTPFSVDQRDLPVKSELKPGTRRVLVLGDSVAGKLGLVLRYRQDEFGSFVAERSVGDCSLLTNFTVNKFGESGPSEPGKGCAADWVKDVNVLKPDVTLIVLGGGFFSQVVVDGKYLRACDVPFKKAYGHRLHELLDGIAGNAGQIAMLTTAYPLGRWRGEDTLETIDCFNEILVGAAKDRSIPLIDLAHYLCPTSECNLFSKGEPIRPDGLHPDGVGAEETGRWTFGEIERIFGKPLVVLAPSAVPVAEEEPATQK